MSNEAIAWAKAQHITSSPQKLLYILLAERVNNETGKCFPGQKLLAEEATMSERQVREHLKALEDARYIERSKRFKEDGSPTSDSYTFPGFLDWLADSRTNAREAHRVAAEIDHRRKSAAGDFTSDHRRVSVSTTGGNPPPNHKKNPKKNPKGDAFASSPDLNADFAISEKPTTAKARLPEDWKPDATLHAWASSKWKLESWQVDVAADAFTAYWHEATGQRAKKADWRKAFQVWVQKDVAQLRRMPKPTTAKAEAVSGEEKTLAREWADYQKTQSWPSYGFMQKHFSGPDSVPNRIKQLAARLFPAGGQEAYA